MSDYNPFKEEHMEDIIINIEVSWYQKVTNWYRKYICTIDKVIGYITIITFLYVLLYYFVFIEIDEIIPYTAKIGEFIYPICLSIIAAFIFYFWTVHYPQVNQKEKFDQHMIESISDIEDYCRVYILEPIKEKYGLQFVGKYPTEAEWENFINHLQITGNINWVENITQLTVSIKPEIEKILLLKDYHPDVFEIILKVKSSLVRFEEIFKDANFNVYTFNQPMIKDILDYLVELNNYYNKKLAPTLFRDKFSIKS